MVTFGVMGWGAPVANQEFRTSLAGDDRLPKGFAELTLGELRSMRYRTWVTMREPRAQSPQAAIDVWYHRRYALPAASLVLILLFVARRRDTNHLLLASQGAIACGIHYGLMVAGEAGMRRGWMSGAVSAWLPNIVFMTAATALALRRLRAATPAAAIARPN